MRRKNRKWVAIAAGLYLLVTWSAYRWGIAQRPADGNIFAHIEREGVRRLAEERAKVEADAPKPTGETRLNAAGPAFVAARYDATHVVFMVVAETESRFAASVHFFSGNARKVPAPIKPSAPLAGLQELWEPDSQSLHFFPEIVQQTQPGEHWWLDLSAESTIPVVIDRTVIAPTGCSLAMGFLATVPPENQPTFAASGQEYFAVRHKAVESADPAVRSRIAELKNWKLPLADANQIEEALTDRMKQEVEKIDSRLVANAGSPGATAGQAPVGHALPRTKEWLHVDRGLMRGEGMLDYDVRAFRLTPDAVPRIFVRARWKLVNAPVFLMTAWFKSDSLAADPSTTDSSVGSLKKASSQANLQQAKAGPVLLSADSRWSSILREGETAGDLGESLDFQNILNVFDADHDGWAELLIHSDQGGATTISASVYSDLGLAPLKTALRRDRVLPESCVDP